MEKLINKVGEPDKNNVETDKHFGENDETLGKIDQHLEKTSFFGESEKKSLDND